MIVRWDIITIGNLSRNRYWGESDEAAVRPALCTSTLITGETFRLLVDPPVADGEAMAHELNRRTGLALTDVTDVFVTHSHGDHLAGLWNFPDAHWYAAHDVAVKINAADRLSQAVEPAPPSLYAEVEVIATPGHTPIHHSLRFKCDGRTVVVAGDAVMTRDFWRDRRGYFNSADFDLATETIGRLAEIADIIVPGHDNCFLV